MPKSPQFMKLLQEMAEVHEKKNDDYTTSGVFENFERMAQISSWFVDDIDKTFATMLTVKLARLASLLGRKSPKNESILDTFKDMTIYAGLWTAYHMESIELDVSRDQSWDREYTAGANEMKVPYHNQEAETELWDGTFTVEDRLRQAIFSEFHTLTEGELQKILSDIRAFNMRK